MNGIVVNFPRKAQQFFGARLLFESPSVLLFAKQVRAVENRLWERGVAMSRWLAGTATLATHSLAIVAPYQAASLSQSLYSDPNGPARMVHICN